MNKKEKQEKQQKKPHNKGDGKQSSQQQKSKPPKTQKGENSEDVKRDQALQAILLADSFTRNFRPISLDSPKVLLPLVNIPMLDYTMEFLAQNGVEEVFVFCVWHADRVEAYLNSSKWPKVLSVKCISSTSCQTAGDALRELDTMNIIRSDPFILISGDVVSNLNLKKAIAFHKQKRKEDNNNVLTVVLKKIQKSAGAKPIHDDLVVGLDSSSSQIVLFDDTIERKNINIPLGLMEEHPRLQFHTDLLDCNVDICSPELMLQFSDNFDYQDIRRDFIRNEVGNYALGKHIFGYIIQNEYAARVQDPRTYHTICRDIVTRWVYPLVPDAQLLQDSSYVHTKRYTYKEQGTKVARSASIEEGVVLGRGTIIGEDVKLTRTVIGRNCSVGNNSTISESHIWSGAKIENNVKMTQSIVCEGAVVKSGAIISRGCIISKDVIIGEGVIVPEFTRITLHDPNDYAENVMGNENSDIFVKYSSSTTQAPRSYDIKYVGNNGKGYVWTLINKNYDENSEEIMENYMNKIKGQSIGCYELEKWKQRLWNEMLIPENEEDYDDDDDDDEYGDGDDHHDDLDGEYIHSNNNDSNNSHSHHHDHHNSGNNTNSGTKNQQKQQLTFAQIVSDMILTGHSEGHPADNLLLEVKGLKFAQNKSYADCLHGIVPAILQITRKLSGEIDNKLNTKDFINNFKIMTKVNGWGYKLIKTMTQDTLEEVEIVTSIEDYVLDAKNGINSQIFRFILQMLYDTELLTTEGLTEWIEARESMAEDDEEDDPLEIARVKLFGEGPVKEFVEWIQEDDEEDDDEEEEDDE